MEQLNNVRLDKFGPVLSLTNQIIFCFQVKRDYEALKARYAELSKLRSTEAEDALAEHRRLSEARDAAAERTIKSLQTENERLKRELAQARLEGSQKTSNQNEEAVDSVSKVLAQEKDEKISQLQKCKLPKVYAVLNQFSL